VRARGAPALTGVTVLGLALMGCRATPSDAADSRGTTSVSAPSLQSGSADDLARVVRAAGLRTEREQSASFEASLTLTVAGLPTLRIPELPGVPVATGLGTPSSVDLVYRGSGAYDRPAGRARLKLDADSAASVVAQSLGGVADRDERDSDDESGASALLHDALDAVAKGTSIQTIVDGRTVYQRSRLLSALDRRTDDTWTKVDLGVWDTRARSAGIDPQNAPAPIVSAVGNGLAGLAVVSADPVPLVALLAGLEPIVEDQGRETVRGVACTRYRTTVDIDQAITAPHDDAGGGSVRESLRALRSWVPEGEGTSRLGLPVEVSVSDQGSICRLQLTLGTASGDGLRVSAQLRYDFFDLGAPALIEPPPRTEVVDLLDLGITVR